MKQVVFPQKKVTSFLKSHFVLAMLDIMDDKTPSEYGYIGVPTFYIISPDGKKLGRILGGMSADNFIKKLKRIHYDFH